MMLIDTSDRKRWKKIEKDHKDWFYEYWTNNKFQEVINSLKIEEKKFIYDLFDENNINTYISEEKIKNYITYRNLKKFKTVLKTYNELIDKSDITNSIIKDIESSKDNLKIKKCKNFGKN